MLIFSRPVDGQTSSGFFCWFFFRISGFSHLRVGLVGYSYFVVVRTFIFQVRGQPNGPDHFFYVLLQVQVTGKGTFSPNVLGYVYLHVVLARKSLHDVPQVIIPKDQHPVPPRKILVNVHLP